MNFDTPIPFLEAIATATEREPMTTALPTRELRKLSKDVLDRSVFSARTTNATYVQKIKDAVERIITPQTESGQRVGFAQMREELGQLLQELQYDPERGFPGDDELGVPPAEAGSLRDLGSEPRLNLMLETQVRQMLGAGYSKASMDPLRLEQFPAWELVRIYDRKVERLDWERRWLEAGGELYDGRMIARKDSDVWNQLGNSELFPDGLDNPYEPFAWGSGMGRVEVAWEECIALGVIEEDEEVAPLPFELNESLAAQAANFSPEILDELERELGEDAARLLGNRNGLSGTHEIRNRMEFLVALLNDGTSEGAHKGWETRRLNAGAKIDDVLSGKSQGESFAEVSPRTAAQIRRATGIDVRGFQHHLDKDGLTHIDARHGRGETSAKNEPITSADIRRIPEIVDAPDKIMDGGTSGRGLPSIKYQKKIGSTVYYVEEVWQGEKKLAAKTMWKTKAALGNSATLERGVSHTSVTSKAASRTIGQARLQIKTILDLFAPESGLHSLTEVHS